MTEYDLFWSVLLTLGITTALFSACLLIQFLVLNWKIYKIDIEEKEYTSNMKKKEIANRIRILELKIEKLERRS